MEPNAITNNPKTLKLRNFLRIHSITAESPMDLPYMIRLSKTLESLGAWPYKTMGFKKQIFTISNKFLFGAWTYTLIFAATYIIKYQKSRGFLSLGHTYITSLMNIVSWHRLTLTWTQSYKQTVSDFVKKFHLFHFKDSSDYSMKIFIEIDTIAEYFTRSLFYQAYSAAVAFLLIPFYYNLTNGMYSKNRPSNMTFDNGISYQLPFNYETNLRNHLIVYAVNMGLSYNCALVFSSFDALLMLIVFHLWGHLKMLKYKLQSFPKPARKGISEIDLDMYDEEESKNVSRLLADILEYHKLIKDYMKQASNGFGSMMYVYSAFHQITLCILLLECTGHDFAQTVRFGIITIYSIQQLIQLSLIFELIDTESSTIKDYIYNLPWESMNTKNRNTVYLFLMVNKEPLSFKALGVLPIGVTTMCSILKTTVSYYMLLRTFAKRNI